MRPFLVLSQKAISKLIIFLDNANQKELVIFKRWNINKPSAYCIDSFSVR